MDSAIRSDWLALCLAIVPGYVSVCEQLLRGCTNGNSQFVVHALRDLLFHPLANIPGPFRCEDIEVAILLPCFTRRPSHMDLAVASNLWYAPGTKLSPIKVSNSP
jgi:hypothetical protein